MNDSRLVAYFSHTLLISAVYKYVSDLEKRGQESGKGRSAQEKGRKQFKEEELENSFNLEKMVRAPCCEKMGLKKGPWTPEEDHILVSFIHRYGHDNWRALPKQAGLLRCGKSCRLRWVNYLRPDIKRGNFSKEEEETIIRLHDKLGNRWSAIAAKLPGRTDNEIKNVWHTHLKKLVGPSNPSKESKKRTKLDAPPLLPALQRSNSDDLSSCATDSSAISVGMSSDEGSKAEGINSSSSSGSSSSLSTEGFADEIDENFWLDALSMEEDDSAASVDVTGLEIPSPPPPCPEIDHLSNLFSSSDSDDKDFWRRIFMGSAGDPQELSQIQLIF